MLQTYLSKLEDCYTPAQVQHLASWASRELSNDEFQKFFKKAMDKLEELYTNPIKP